MSLDDDELDPRLAAQLREELHRQLDGQLGGAARHFRQRHAAGIHRVAAGRSRRRWLVPLSAVAAAACLVLIVGRHVGKETSQLPRNRQTATKIPEATMPPAGDEHAASDANQHPAVADAEAIDNVDTVAAPPAATSLSPLLVARALRSRAIDEGTLLLDGRAVRKIRRQWLERVEWFDPQHGARLERIVPHEQVVFLPLSIN
ncbi:MAG TPA: hypothetical protein VJ783_05250 [Pirellulales bacterium]|nr:hypothetical protein [Pirellulales bacterium]